MSFCAVVLTLLEGPKRIPLIPRDHLTTASRGDSLLLSINRKETVECAIIFSRIPDFGFSFFKSIVILRRKSVVAPGTTRFSDGKLGSFSVSDECPKIACLSFCRTCHKTQEVSMRQRNPTTQQAELPLFEGGNFERRTV